MRRQPLDPRLPFTRAQALIAGLTDADLTGSDYQQLFWGVYVSSRVVANLSLRARAALLLSPPGSVVSHHTAARLWGGVPPDDGDIHVTGPPGIRQRTRGIRPHRFPETPPATRRRGLPVTSPEQTFCDMGQWCNLVDLVILGDSLVRARATTPARLEAAAETMAGLCRSLVLRCARLVRADVDSPMETRLRLLIVLAGLPEPVVNLRILHDDGRLRYRLDLSYPSVTLAIEFDGRHHATVGEQWEGDIARREDLENEKWRFVLVTSTQLYSDPGAVLRRIHLTARELGLPVPRRLRTTWQQHFVGSADVR